MDVITKNGEETYLEVVERQLYNKISALVSENRYKEAREVAEILDALRII